MPIIDDDFVRICPSDIIGWDNRGAEGVRLGKNSSENQYQTTVRLKLIGKLDLGNKFPQRYFGITQK